MAIIIDISIQHSLLHILALCSRDPHLLHLCGARRFELPASSPLAFWILDSSSRRRFALATPSATTKVPPVATYTRLCSFFFFCRWLSDQSCPFSSARRRALCIAILQPLTSWLIACETGES